MNKAQELLGHKPGEEEYKELSPCCLRTLQEFVANNPMVSCHACKTLLKCFTHEIDFQKYLYFCKNRKRKVDVAKFKEYWVVFYRPYQP